LRSFQWRIAIPFLALIVASMGVLGIYLVDSVRNSQLDNLRVHLEQEARLTAEASLPALLGQADAPDVLAKRLGKEINSRVTIIAPDGKVLGDSVENPAAMENHGARPEVKDALATGTGESTRFSTTLQEQEMYVAVTVTSSGKVLGIARVALPVTSVDKSANHVTQTVILATVIITVLALLAAWLIARTTTRPIRLLTRASREIAAGKLGQKITVSTKDELGQLAQAFNEMSSNLKSMLDTLSIEK
jgi:two-component system phosphate regulon sensor histidine kinase PhoR